MNKDKSVKVTFKKSELEILQSLLQDILDTQYHSSWRDEDIEVGGDITNLLNKIKKHTS